MPRTPLAWVSIVFPLCGLAFADTVVITGVVIDPQQQRDDGAPVVLCVDKAKKVELAKDTTASGGIYLLVPRPVVGPAGIMYVVYCGDAFWGKPVDVLVGASEGGVRRSKARDLKLLDRKHVYGSDAAADYIAAVGETCRVLLWAGEISADEANARVAEESRQVLQQVPGLQLTPLGLSPVLERVMRQMDPKLPTLEALEPLHFYQFLDRRSRPPRWQDPNVRASQRPLYVEEALPRPHDNPSSPQRQSHAASEPWQLRGRR